MMMKRLLMTSVIAVPLGLGAAYAQETTTQVPAEDNIIVIEPEATEVQPGAAGQELGQGGEGAEGITGGPAQGTGGAVVQGGQTAPVAEGGTAAPVQGTATGDAIERQQAMNELRVDWITGSTVRSPQGETIGNIRELILDNETGRLTAAIVSVGGFLGIGAKQIAISWDDLQVDYDANEITSTITREEADAAPEYVFRDQGRSPGTQQDATGTVVIDSNGDVINDGAGGVGNDGVGAGGIGTDGAGAGGAGNGGVGAGAAQPAR